MSARHAARRRMWRAVAAIGQLTRLTSHHLLIVRARTVPPMRNAHNTHWQTWPSHWLASGPRELLQLQLQGCGGAACRASGDIGSQGGGRHGSGGQAAVRYHVPAGTDAGVYRAAV
jgi:hypothetical protein